MANPKHVAIIMDGNGRWAQARGRERVFGHVKGARRARQIITHAAELGIENLTLFAFSTENWSRPPAEVRFLMQLLRRYLQKERKSLIRNNIRFRCIGDLSRLPSAVLDEVRLTTAQTQNLNGMNLTVALNYGGRQDITSAARRLGERIAAGELAAEQITEELFAQHLQTQDLIDPDLLIRTSGELRISNFLLWQCAYSEFYFSDTLWPDLTAKHFSNAVLAFAQRQRRFGGLQDQETLALIGPQVELGPERGRRKREVARILSVLRPEPAR